MKFQSVHLLLRFCWSALHLSRSSGSFYSNTQKIPNTQKLSRVQELLAFQVCMPLVKGLMKKCVHL